MTEMIKSNNVSFQYLHTTEAFLKEINLTVDRGEVILICGASGSGKSTYSRLLNGISPNYIEGELTGEHYTADLKAGEADIEAYVPIVGSVFQNPKTQHFTVDTTSELAFPLENMGVHPDFIQTKVMENAKALDVEHLLGRNIFEISGGEKQQIAFVASNMLEPTILILDEVTSNLDQEAIIRIREMVLQLKARGQTIIIFEHRLAWTKDLVDRYIRLEDGKVSHEWTADEFQILSNDDLHALGLRSTNLDSHREIIQTKLNNQRDSNNCTLTTENLSIGYPGHTVLTDLHLSFNAGEVTGLLGPNGTGKSTFANTLTGLQDAISGQIYWNNKKITKKALIQKSYMVMQDMNYQLFSDSVENEILLGAKHPKYLDILLEELNLTEFRDRHPMSLSEGQKQRVVIASALLSGKEIIIFDEPTSGLDYEHMERFGKLLKDLKDSKAVIIVITHDEELASKWCDSIVKLNKK